MIVAYSNGSIFLEDQLDFCFDSFDLQWHFILFQSSLLYPVIKKVKPLYTIYNYIYNQVQRQIEDHKREVEAFKRKQKELGL